ncbi:O-Antigen ligase [compost metagenome]
MDELSTGRLGIWSYLVPYIAERPWFGWGGEGFQAVWTGFPIRQAHNGLMQLLIEWGCVGATLYAVMIGWLLLKGWGLYLASVKKDGAATELTYGIALTTALLVLSVIDGVFYYGMTMSFLVTGFACVGKALAGRRPGIAAG